MLDFSWMDRKGDCHQCIVESFAWGQVGKLDFFNYNIGSGENFRGGYSTFERECVGNAILARGEEECADFFGHFAFGEHSSDRGEAVFRELAGGKQMEWADLRKAVSCSLGGEEYREHEAGAKHEVGASGDVG